jgi:hypothetical protein
MRDFFRKLMSDDETHQNYTREELILYGILVPIGFIILMCIAGWLDTLY